MPLDDHADNGRWLSDDFWKARPELAHIHAAGLARTIAPEAVLGCVLARLSAFTPLDVNLPPVVARRGSLNLLVLLTAAPGMGKGSALDLADELLAVPFNLRGAFTSRPLGSGEGLVRAFFDWAPDPESEKGKKILARKFSSLLIRVDEGSVFRPMAARNGQTTMETLRQAFSGELIGGTYRAEEANLHLDAHSYRLALVGAIQPANAASLLEDAAGGTPQRILWLPATNPSLPRDPPPYPGPLTWSWPTAFVNGPRRDLTVDDQVAEEVMDAHWLRVTGQSNGDGLDAHRNLIRLKVGGILSIWARRTNIAYDDWTLAGHVTACSTATMREAIAAVAAEGAVKARARIDGAAAQASAAHQAVEASDDTRIDRMARVVAHHVHKHNGDDVFGCKRRCISQALGRDYRRTDQAISAADDRGWIEETVDPEGTRRWRPDKRPADV